VFSHVPQVLPVVATTSLMPVRLGNET